MGKAPVVILEGTWWSNHEVPLVLPYFHALSSSHGGIRLSHRTIRSVEDIAYYVKKIPTNAGTLLYFACHGEDLCLKPTGERGKISQGSLLSALSEAKDGAISFVHFGCCEMIDPKNRRDTHEKIMEATKAKWSSGYTTSVDWLSSTLLDLALVTEVFVPQRGVADGRKAKLKKRASSFVNGYEQLARQLGFSAMSQVTNGSELFPKRLRQ